MGKTIQVTSAQVNAARLWIERADREGAPIPDGIRKLANAKPRPISGVTAPSGALPAAPVAAESSTNRPLALMHRPDGVRGGS